MKTIGMVVAKYNCDISWTKRISDEVQLFIYDKKPTPETPKEHIILPDIGRETYMFLYHVVKNYNDLNPITIFTQGYPLDHISDFVEKVNSMNEYVSKNGVNGCAEFGHFGQPIIACNRKGEPQHNGESKPGFVVYREFLPMEDFYRKVFPDECPQLFFCAGISIFFTKKERILRRPVNFYQKLIEMISYAREPIEAWVFERMWNLVFPSELKIERERICGSENNIALTMFEDRSPGTMFVRVKVPRYFA